MSNTSTSTGKGCGMGKIGEGSFSCAMELKRFPGENSYRLYDRYLQDTYQNGCPTMTRARYDALEGAKKSEASLRAKGEGAWESSESAGSSTPADGAEDSQTAGTAPVKTAPEPSDTPSQTPDAPEDGVLPRHLRSILYPALSNVSSGESD